MLFLLTGAGGQPGGGQRAGGAAQPAKVQRQVLEGFVKNGVVHLLEGTLPEGIIVKIIRE